MKKRPKGPPNFIGRDLKKALLIMKLSFILIAFCFNLAAAGVFSQGDKLSVHYSEITVKQILKEIEEKSDYSFFYKDEDLELDKRVSLSSDASSIEELLKGLLASTSLDFKMVGEKFIVIAPVEQFQGVNVSGEVTGENGELLPGVNVVEKGTTNGTITDLNGRFSLTVSSPEASLVISYMGYENIELFVGDQREFNITLQESITELDEVVVVGYGTQLRRDLTGSVTTIDADEIATMKPPRIEQALVGRAAGVQIQQVNSAPGAGLKIRIRGENSLNGDNDPLVVIDGVLGGSLRALNPNEIQSFQVLKDASATAIYGSRGANGVIIIETHRGRPGRTNVSLDVNIGTHQISKKIDVLNAEEHYSLLQASDQFTGIDIPNPILSGEGTDWQDVISQTGLYQDYHLTVSGGNEKTRFALMGNFMDQEGVIKQSKYTKSSVRLNLDHNLTDKLRVGNNFLYYRSGTDGVKINQGSGSWGQPLTLSALLFSPIAPVYDDEGNYSQPISTNLTMDNPLQQLNERPQIRNRSYFLNNVFAEWDILPDLTFKASGTYSYISNLNTLYIGKNLLEVKDLGQASLNNSFNNRWLVENTLTYKKDFEDHRINIVGGFTAESEVFRGNGTTVRGFATETMTVNNIGIAEEVIDKYSSYSKNTLASFLGRATYSFRNKYLFTASARADGASKFAKNNKWAFFPSGSVSWVLSRESFMENISQVSNLKVRASYGETGSQAIGTYQSLASFQSGVRYVIGQEDFTNGVRPGRIENADLRWETTRQTNLGLDFGIYDQRITLTVDVYSKKTDDLLYNKQLPRFSGYTSQIQNIGSMENRGLEVSVAGTPVQGEFTWDLSANISKYVNKVTSLGDDSVIYRNGSFNSLGGGYKQTGVLLIGEPIGNFYGYVVDGIFQDDQDVASLPQAGAQPGLPKYKDTNGDGEITADDRVIIGNALPDFTFGFTSMMTYKGFDLNILVSGAIGFDVANLMARRLEEPGGYRNGNKNSLNYWTPGSGINDMVGIDMEYPDMSSKHVEDGTYVKIRNIALGYSFPQNLTSKFGLQQLRLSVNLVNWITFTKYSGFDPEVSSWYGGSNFSTTVDQGYDYGSYPAVRQLMFGLNVGF